MQSFQGEQRTLRNSNSESKLNLLQSIVSMKLYPMYLLIIILNWALGILS